MARKAFLLRVDPELLAAVQRWADADLRSLNGQIEFILREAAMKRGVKLPPETDSPPESGGVLETAFRSDDVGHVSNVSVRLYTDTLETCPTA